MAQYDSLTELFDKLEEPLRSYYFNLLKANVEMSEKLNEYLKEK